MLLRQIFVKLIISIISSATAQHFLRLPSHPGGLNCTMHFIRPITPQTSNSFWRSWWTWELMTVLHHRFPKTITTLQANEIFVLDSTISFLEQCTLTVLFESTYEDALLRRVDNIYKSKSPLFSTLLIMRLEGCNVPYAPKRNQRYSYTVFYYFGNCPHINPRKLPNLFLNIFMYVFLNLSFCLIFT